MSRLLCLFSFWASGSFVMSFKLGPRPLSFYFAYFILSSLRVILYLFVYFASNCYLSLKVMFVFVSCYIVFFVFIHVKCYLIVFRNLIVLLIILCLSRNYLFVLFFVFNYDSYFKMLFCLKIV